MSDACRNRAEERFTEIFGQIHRVAAYARRRGAADPEEIAAETMAIAWHRLADVPHDDPLPWLLATARNVLWAANRKRARVQVGLDGIPEPADEDPVFQASGIDARLLGALAALPALDREALLLVAWEELSPAQAATALGISSVAFRVRLHRARRRCATALGRPTATAAMKERTSGA